ncbi:MAG: flagellar hook-length control protein FliK, partial [Candidatus Kapabacteria bacterium]|nr:flagellar hook-length control protein FliK [Candidatus Kapabacteria bacterium]
NIKQNFAEAVNINPKEMKSDGVNILKDAFTPEKSTDSKDVKSEVRPDTIIPRVDIKQNFVEAVNINPKEAKSDGVNILKDAFTPEKPIDSKDVKSEVRPDTIIPRVNIKQNFAEAVNINPKQVKTENNISSNEAKLIDYKSDIKDIKVEIKRESVVSQTEKVILQDVKSPLKLNIETPPTDKIVNSKDIVINKPDNTELSKNDNNLPPNKDFSTKSSALNSDVLLRLNNIRFVDSLFTGKDFNPINIQPKFLNNQPIENISKGELNLQINNMKFVQNIISNGKLSEFEQNTKSTEPLKILHSDSIKTEIEETKNSAELSPKNDIPKIAKLLDNMFNTSASDNLQIEINSNNKNIQNISPINSTPKFKSETQNDKNPSNSPKIEIQESNVQYSASLIESSDSGELKASLQEDKPTFTDKITSKDDVMISNKLTELKEPVSSITSMINNNVNQPELVQNSIKKVEISPASEVKSSSLSKQSEFSNSNNGGENYTGFGNTDKNSNSNQSEEFQKKASNPFIKNLENASSRQLKSSNQTQAKPEMPSYMTFTRVKLGNMPGILSDIVSNSSGNYIGTAKLILTPKSLGTIFVEINVSEDSVKLNFKADSRETTKAIESNIANLRDKIESNGVKIENININHFTGEQKKDASAQRDRNNETGNRNKSGVFDMDKILNEKEPIDIEPKTRQRFDQGNYIEQYI